MKLTVMSPDNMNAKSTACDHVEGALAGALLLTEVGVDLRGCYVSGVRCVGQLKSIVNGTEKTIKALQATSRCALEQAYKMVSTIDSNERVKEREELIAIIKKQLDDLEHKESIDTNHCQRNDSVRMLETKQKSCDNIPWSVNSKGSKGDINEKYPGSISRESLIDLNSVTNLPPVPEDIFTSFSTKPTRSSSLSSLKSMRKVKMFLQKAENSDDEDSSEVEEHDYPKTPVPKLAIGDMRSNRSVNDFKLPSPIGKKLLGNITEETKVDE
ncbi:unnamed protein product [Phyllotreta striolata]|uniref:Uncharacterized protein n=1 Tax=Phyllotreta striolata TaxID=444603 RepID=A0A9N9TYF7_PHYSR|nr:unnamed protein product [Phyllotreta striolata]